MFEALRKLRSNLKTWAFHLDPKYGLDKNEAAELIEDINRIEMELYTIGVLRRATENDKR